MRLVPRVLLISLGLLTGLAAPASAADLHVAAPPAGSQDCSSVANACSLDAASNAVKSNDQILLGAGTIDGANVLLQYGANPTATTLTGVTIKPEPGVTRPTIQVGSTQLRLVGGITIQDVNVGGKVFLSHEAMMDRVRVTGSVPTGDGLAYLGFGAKVRSSIVRNTGAGGAALISYPNGVSTSFNVSGSTIIADGAGGQALVARPENTGGKVTGYVANTILRGAGKDIVSTPGGGSTVELTVVTSNFRNDASGLSNGPGTTFNAMAPQSVAPVFVDAANGDFRQAPSSSSTIDKGTYTNDPVDFDGNPRYVGGGTDIGAYEVQAAATPTPVATPTPTPVPTPVVPTPNLPTPMPEAKPPVVEDPTAAPAATPAPTAIPSQPTFVPPPAAAPPAAPIVAKPRTVEVTCTTNKTTLTCVTPSGTITCTPREDKKVKAPVCTGTSNDLTCVRPVGKTIKFVCTGGTPQKRIECTVKGTVLSCTGDVTCAKKTCELTVTVPTPAKPTPAPTPAPAPFKVDPDVPVGPQGRAFFKLTCTGKAACDGGLVFTLAGEARAVKIEIKPGAVRKISVDAPLALKALKADPKTKLNAFAKPVSGPDERKSVLSAVKGKSATELTKLGFTKITPRLLKPGEKVSDATYVKS